MKVPILPTAFLTLLGLVFSGPASVHASPSPLDSLHFFLPPDFQPDPYASASAKRLADLDPGEPRTVYLFYSLLEDRPFRPEVVQKIKDDIIFIQARFGEQMEAHGFGYKTFRFETDEEGEPRVHLRGVAGVEQAELDLSKNIVVTVVDNGTHLIDGVRGRASFSSKQSGSALVPSEYAWYTLAHELGHAFGMGHDFRDDRYIMSYGTLNRGILSACAASFLAFHPYFNPEVGVEWAEEPVVELLSEPFYPEGSETVQIRLRLSDAHGLHLLRLRVPRIGSGDTELKLCRGFSGEEEAVVEIEYDGVVPSGSAFGLSDLSDPKVHPIALTVLDRDGNRGGSRFDLWEVSAQHLTTFELVEEVHAVTFAPGGTLVSGSTEGVEFWDLETQRGTATSRSGAGGGATTVALSPDGAILASGAGGEVELWDTAAGRVIATLSGHTNTIRSLAFSPDGAMLASGALDAIRLWDLETRTRRATLPVDAAAVAFSPDGTALVAGSAYGVQLWDLATQTAVATYPHFGVSAVAFSPDGTLVASGGGDATVQLWNVATGENLGSLEGQGYYTPPPVTSVAFSPDGTLLAFGVTFEALESLGVHVWDPVTKERLATLQGEGKGVNTVAFSLDGTTLAAGTQNGRIDLWDVSEWLQPRPRTLVKISGDGQQNTPGSQLANPYVVEVRDQYGNPLQGVQVTYTVTAGDGLLGDRFSLEKVTTDADGRAEAVLTLGSDPATNTVEVVVAALEPVMFSAVGVGTPSTLGMEGDFQKWHLPPGAISRLGKGHMGFGDKQVVFSPDGQLLALGTHLGIWLYEVATSRELALLRSDHISALAFSPDGSMLASAGAWRDRSIKLWDVATGNLMETIDLDLGAAALAFSPDGSLVASGGDGGITLWDLATRTRRATLSSEEDVWGIRSLAFSPDGSTLAAGSWWDNEVKLLDVATATITASLDGHTGAISSVAFSPDGSLVASGGDDSTVRLWDLSTGTHIALEGHARPVYSVAFSPAGTILASGSHDDTVKLWDVATRTPTASYEGHRSWVLSVSFSPDGTVLASGSVDGTVKLWDVATGNAYTFAREHRGEGPYLGLAFSPDGTILASGGSDRTIRLWDVATGANTAMLEGHQGSPIHDVTFSPDGTILASGSADRTIRLWDVATGANTATLKSLEDGGVVLVVVFSPDGTILASGHVNGTAKLWDVATGTRIATLEGHARWLSALAFSPDGTTLASMSRADMIKLWNVATRTSTATFELPVDSVISLWFSSDGLPLASGRQGDSMIELWDLAANTRLASPSSEELWVDSAVLSPDQSLMIFWGDIVNERGDNINEKGFLEVQNMATGTHVATIKGHGDRILTTVFSHDGRFFASGSHDGTIVLWDTQLVLPHPRTLTKLSGDNQQGIPGTGLAHPFVVFVRDQHDEPLEGVEVTFAVTAGGGILSTTSVTTDENGRASATLTLGSDPGRNTVAVRAATLNPVIFSATGQAIPKILTKLSGDDQEGWAGIALAQPFVVSVLDQTGEPFPGAAVTFALTSGYGTLSVETATTDSMGLASSTLTLGPGPATSTVEVTVADLEPVVFTAVAAATPDFDGDGVTNFGDFFLFADAFGTTDTRFDLDGSGVVDFGDFFLFADAFGQPARAKLLALAAELIGLPAGPQLQQNRPNPFNSQTVIPYFLLAPGQARLEVYGLTGQRVALLRQGPQRAGLHRLYWDGRDGEGRPLASGIYFYRLVTAEGVLTRKLLLLR